MNNKSIGIFDSGFGGITVLREIVKKLPQYNYIYFGDTARAPYGSRSQNIIYQFSRQAVEFLFERGCQLIILACNTASAEALRKIQKEYLPKYQNDSLPQRKRGYKTKRVLGVIIPTSEIAVETTKNNKIGVMATERTVESLVFSKEIKKINPQIQVLEFACPLLVPIIESGEHNSEIIYPILEKYLKPLVNNKIDTLILGCTHYSILEDKIKKIIPANIQILSEPKIIAAKLKDYLDRRKKLENQLSKNSNIKFFTTDLTNKFEKLGSEFFGKDINKVHNIESNFNFLGFMDFKH